MMNKDVLEYKGYHSIIEFDMKLGLLRGKIDIMHEPPKTVAQINYRLVYNK